MPIARRATASATNPTSATTLTGTWNVTPVNGDLLVAVVAAIVQTTITPPSGWTLLATQDSGSALRGWLYSRTAASEPGSNTWTIGSSSKCFLQCAAYSGANPGSLVSLSSTGTTTPAVTVPDQGWLVSAAAGRHATTGVASTWTVNDAQALELLDFGSSGGSQDIAGAVYDSNRALSSGSYSRVLTSSQTETTSIAFAVAFGPTSTGGGGGTTGARWGIHL